MRARALRQIALEEVVISKVHKNMWVDYKIGWFFNIGPKWFHESELRLGIQKKSVFDNVLISTRGRDFFSAFFFAQTM